MTTAHPVLPCELLPPGDGWNRTGDALPDAGVVETWDSTRGPETGFATVRREGPYVIVIGTLRAWWRPA